MSSILQAFMGLLLLSSAAAAVSTTTGAVHAIPQGPAYSVTLTAYNAVPAQTKSDPSTTASGSYSNPEVVAARSQEFAKDLPFGTIIEIDGPAHASDTCGYNVVSPLIGYRVIADTMNAYFTDRIDVLFDTKSNYIMPDGSTKNASTILGLCHDVTIRVVGYVDISNPSHLPKTQKELAALVENGGNSSIALK